MFISTFLQSVAICSVVLLCPAAGADEPQMLLDELAVSWQGDGQLRATKDEQGRVVFLCECQGDVRVSNRHFQAQARRLAYDSAKQTLLLEGNVRLQVRKFEGQPAAGQLIAERVTLKIADDQLLMESTGAKLHGTVQLHRD